MALARLASFLRHSVRRLRPRPSRETVLFTEDHLVLVWPQRGEEAVEWDEISRISLRATRGLAGSDALFVYVVAGRNRLVIPRSAVNADQLLGFIRTLPGCDTDLFDQALAGASAESADERLVTVWQRPQG